MTKVNDIMLPFIVVTVGLILSLALNIGLVNQLDTAKAQLIDCNTVVSMQDDKLIEQDNREEEVYQELDKYNIPEAKAMRLVPIILSASEQYNIDTKLIIAQMRVESNFKPYAYSWAGARGLMQVMPFWTKVKHFQKNTGITTVEELHTLEGSIRAGTYIQSHYIDKCGGLKQGLACYNGGPRALYKPKAETTNYVKQVMKHYNRMLV